MLSLRELTQTNPHRYPLTPQYPAQSFDTGTTYTGYQPDPVSDANTQYHTNPARYHSHSYPPPRPPKPTSPYFRGDPYSSFMPRGQHRDYTNVPSNDYLPSPKPLRGRVTRIPLNVSSKSFNSLPNHTISVLIYTGCRTWRTRNGY